MVASLAWAGPGQGEDPSGEDGGHDTGGLDFILKPKGLGQTGQFQFSIDGPAVNYFTRFLGEGLHVESSTDLKQWEEVELLKSTDEETVFQDERNPGRNDTGRHDDNMNNNAW